MFSINIQKWESNPLQVNCQNKQTLESPSSTKHPEYVCMWVCVLHVCVWLCVCVPTLEKYLAEVRNGYLSREKQQRNSEGCWVLGAHVVPGLGGHPRLGSFCTATETYWTFNLKLDRCDKDQRGERAACYMDRCWWGGWREWQLNHYFIN